mgnify:CR=1 FL=1
MSLFSGRITLLDGATGTHMIAAGMPKGVCVEQWVLEHPDVLRTLQREYALAGSDLIYAPTFAANRVGLARYGLEGHMAEINRRLVALSREGTAAHRPGRPDAVVVASVTTTGMFCEPFGEPPFAELIDVYTEQFAVLREEGIPLIVGETLMSMADARAILLAAGRVGLSAAVTITVEQNGRTLSGLTLSAALVTLQAMGAVAVGLNCSTGPAAMADELEKAAPYACVPLIAKPNAGAPGEESTPEEFCQSSQSLLKARAGAIGGCCGTGPEHIRLLRKMLDEGGNLPADCADCPHAAANGSAVFPLTQEVRLSAPVPVDDDLCDAMMDADPDEADALLVQVGSPEEGHALAMESHACPLPIAIEAASAEALEAALLEIQGRALVAGAHTPSLKEVACRYGAILL